MCYADSFQQIQKTRIKRVLLYLAEREGFEPSLGLTLNTLSRRAPSATQPPLRKTLNFDDHFAVVNYTSMMICIL